MTKSIEIEELAANAPVQVHVPAAKVSGWLGWCRPEGCGWVMLYPNYPVGHIHDQHRHPYPLFLGKDDALQAAEKVLPNGGTVKLLYVEI